MPHPLLAPHVLLAWRDEHALAVLDPLQPDSAVTIGNATADTVAWLHRCDGTRSHADLLGTAAAQGVDPTSADAVLRALAEQGLLAMYEPGTLPASEADLRSPSLREAQALALGGGCGEQAVARRRNTLVAITGADRVAHALVDGLAAAGIGALQTLGVATSRRRIALRDVATPGPTAEDVGTQPQTALKRHIARVQPRVTPAARLPLILVTGDYLDAGEEALVRRIGAPYCSVLTTSRTAVIGPLTLPNHSACRTCIDHRQAERDPQLPGLLMQRTHRRREPTPVDTAFALWVAATAAMYLLDVIDRDDPSALVNTTLHLDRPNRTVRRRTWARHPDCTCSWEGMSPAMSASSTSP